MADALAVVPDNCREAGLEALAGAERPTAMRVNERTGHGLRGWGISPATARASASREKTPQPVATIKPAPAPAVAPPIEIPGRVLATFDDYSGLQNSIRARVDEMGLTRLEVDYLSGMQDGYSGKVPRRSRSLESTRSAERLAQSVLSWPWSKTPHKSER
jgi:hypothetical protein